MEETPTRENSRHEPLTRRRGRGHEDHPVGDAGLALDLLGLIERFAGGYVGLSVGAIVGDAEAAVGVGRTGPGGASPGGATSFQIGSVTKVFTSLLLADAVQRGDVALDQRLDSIFPGTATHPDGRPITLVDLATHTSGLPRLPLGVVASGTAKTEGSDPRAPGRLGLVAQRRDGRLLQLRRVRSLNSNRRCRAVQQRSIGRPWKTSGLALRPDAPAS